MIRLLSRIANAASVQLPIGKRCTFSRSRLGFDHLEDRRLLAISAFFDSAAERLTIYGTDAAENLQLTVREGNIDLLALSGRNEPAVRVPIVDVATGQPCSHMRTGDTSCPSTENTQAIFVSLAGGNDNVHLQWNHHVGDHLSNITVDVGDGSDVVESEYAQVAGVTPEPFRAFLMVQGGAGRDTLTARYGFVPELLPPDPMGGRFVPFEMQMHGGAGDDRLASHGMVHPGVVTGFNPQPDPPKLLVTVLDGDGGNDHIHSQTWFGLVPAVITASGDVSHDRLGTSSEASLDNNIGTMQAPPRVEVGAHGGAGNDEISIVLINPPGDDLEFVGNMDGGAGDDRLGAVLTVSSGDNRPTYQPLGQVGITALGRAGNDDIGIFVAPSPAASFDFSAHVDGGAGDDRIRAVLGTSPVHTRLQSSWSGRLSLTLLGGAGNDLLSFDFDNVHLGGGSVELRMDGGVGHDVLDTFFGLLANSHGHIDAEVLGGVGNDLLSLLVSDAIQTNLHLSGLLDGGQGFDFAKASTGVLVLGVERLWTR